MAERNELERTEERVLAAVSTLEDRGDAATIRTIASEAELDVEQAEAATSGLTAKSLLRERLVELDDDQVGAGREFTVRARTQGGST